MIYLQQIIAEYEIMDIGKLKLFITLAEAKHFNRAAEQSHISPSTLTRIIQQLEDTVGARLFERDSRSVALTPKGQEFLRYSRDLLQQWETMCDAMQEGTEFISGSISLYCSVTASYSFLYDILKSFRQQHPRIEVKIHTGDTAAAIERVSAGFEDAAIAARPDRLPANLAFKSITQSPLVFIAPLQDFQPQQVGITPNPHWKDLPFIISERGLARDRLNDWFANQSFAPNIYAQIAGNEAIVSMVSLGFGIGLVPQIVLDNSPLASKVRLFDYQPDLTPYDVGICLQKRRLKSPIIKAFWEQL